MSISFKTGDPSLMKKNCKKRYSLYKAFRIQLGTPELNPARAGFYPRALNCRSIAQSLNYAIFKNIFKSEYP